MRAKRCGAWALSTFSASLALLLPRLAAAQDAKEAAKFIEFFQVSGVLPAVVIIAAASFFLRFVRSATERFGERFADKRLLAQQVGTVLRFFTYIAAFVLVIRALFRLERETLLALTGTIAVALGFALKDLAASVLAGITIIFDRPFQVGDRVTFAGQYGEIITIGLRSVRMVTLDDSVVTIPNNKFLTDLVVSGNAGALDMQVVTDFFISPDAELAKAKRVVTEAVRTSRFVFLTKPVVVLVEDLIHGTYLCTRLRAKAYVLDVRFEKAFVSDVTERVKEGFAHMHIPGPIRGQSGTHGGAGHEPNHPPAAPHE